MTPAIMAEILLAALRPEVTQWAIDHADPVIILVVREQRYVVTVTEAMAWHFDLFDSGIKDPVLAADWFCRRFRSAEQDSGACRRRISEWAVPDLHR